MKKKLNYMDMNDTLLDSFVKAEKQAKGKDRPDIFYIKALVKKKGLVNMMYRNMCEKILPEAFEKMEQKARDLINSIENNEELPTIKSKTAYMILHYKTKYIEAYSNVPEEKLQAYLLGTVVMCTICFKHFLDKGELK